MITTSTSESAQADDVSKPIENSAEDLGGERLVPEDLEGAVLGEDHERHEQAAAEDRRRRAWREGDSKERPDATRPRLRAISS